jgi:hypothetical protein
VLARLVVAGLLAVGVMVLALRGALALVGEDPLAPRVSLLIAVLVTSAIGAGVYLLAAWVMRVHEVGHVLSLVRRIATRGRAARRAG